MSRIPMKSTSTRVDGRAGRWLRLPSLTVIAAGTCSPLLGAGVAPAARSAVDPFDDPTATRTVVPEHAKRHIPDLSTPITSCSVHGAGVDYTCSGSRTYSVTYEVRSEFGVSGEAISASLGISRAETVAVEATCRANKARPGTIYYTYPTVTRHYYHIVADNTRANFAGYGPDGVPAGLDGGSIQRSPQLFADIPDAGVHCQAEPTR